MRKKILVLLAEGFEEMEAVITIDLLRRAGLEVISAAVGDKLLVLGSRKISVQADVFLRDVKDIPDALILPGGANGADNLAASNTVIDLVRRCFREGKVVAAICAAPAVVLAKSGILKGKKATCYPGDEAEFSSDVVFVKEDVVCDGTLITGRGPGTAFSFALAIIRKLCGEQVAANVKEKALIQVKKKETAVQAKRVNMRIEDFVDVEFTSTKSGVTTIIKTKSRDISAGGIKVYLNTRMAPGQKMQVNIKLPGKITVIHAEAESVKSDLIGVVGDEGKELLYETRFKFVNIDVEAKKMITQYVYDCRKKFYAAKVRP